MKNFTKMKKAEDLDFDIKNYQRLFSFYGHIPFISSYQFAQNYLSLGAIVFSDEKEWLTFISKANLQSSLTEGIEIYGSKLAFTSFKDDLYSTKGNIEDVTKRILDEQFDKSTIECYLDLIQRYRSLYKQTEFFFTDRIYEDKDKYPEFEENLKTFDKFKLDGRAFLNKLFYSESPSLFEVISAIAKKVFIEHEDLICYTSEELLKAFDGKRVAEQTVLNRRKAYFIQVINGEIKISEGDEAVKYIEEVRKTISSGQVLKGRVASPGKVTAKAYVIKVSLKDYGSISKVVNEMGEGDVLVVESTEPAVIMACNKASAILTNQGGMMSHASIISRELKIPCIVGLGNATNLINTGDMVEVDAENGVVRILNK